MTWSRPLDADLPTRDEVDRTVRVVLQEAAIAGRDLLEVGTPVRTGRLQGGWEVVPTAAGFEVRNDVPYAPYVDFDERPAVRRFDAINQAMRRAVGALFRR